MFIQIGERYLNIDHIECVRISAERAVIDSDVVVEGDQISYVFRGDDRQAILNWLEYKAEVSVVI